MFGHLSPQGGGDDIPLLKEKLLVGRRESCDIVLRFSNVSAHHCELYLDSGYWYVRDDNSKNGVKVNGKREQHKRLDPGDSLHVAKHKYEIVYNPIDNGATGPPPAEEDQTAKILSKSLLDRAGLMRRSITSRKDLEDRGRDREELL
jgi:adenylate cyclase